MTMTIASAIESTLSLIQQKRYRSALNAMRLLRDSTQHSQSRIVVCYQCGVFHWKEIGDGESARDYFRAAVEICQRELVLKHHKATEQIWANCCENLMLLSLSQEEYEQWAQQLEKLQPDNPILGEQRPKFRKALEEGHPWVDLMQSTASTFYNRNDSNRDRGQYGCAASIWQLVLKNGKSLRLTRDDWGTAVYEHAALTMRIAQHAGQGMERLTRRPAEVEEFLFITDATVPFIDEYLIANPSDTVAQGLRENVREFLSTMRSTVRETRPLPIPFENQPEPGGQVITRHICQRCGRVLGEITSIGGSPGMNSRLEAFGSRDMGMCPHCGGQVRAVREDDSCLNGPAKGYLPLGCCAIAVLVCTGLGWLIGALTTTPNAWKHGLLVGSILGGTWAVMSLLNRFSSRV